MATSVIGALRVMLGLDSAEFEAGATSAARSAQRLQRSIEATGERLSTVGRNLTIGLTAPLAAFGTTAVQAAMESADASAQVQAALASMGTAAGRTQAQLEALAETQMRGSLYDDDEILRKVTANLLTFGNIAGEQFDRAQQAALDLSARLGTDLQGSAMLLGRALNDPVRGLNALTRSGVSFTAQQREQIKAMVAAGDAAGAQALMLAELERQFGGAAAAARAANPMAAMQQSWAEFQETVGQKLLPLLPRITDAITGVLDAFGRLSPRMQTFAVGAGLVAAAVGPVLMALGGLISVTAPLTSVLLSLAGTGGLLTGAGAAFSTLAGALTPLLPIIAAVGAAGLVIYANWDKIKPVLDRVWQAFQTNIGEPLQALITALKTRLEELWGGPLGTMVDAAMGKLREFGQWTLRTLGGPLVQMLNIAADVATRAFGVIGGAITTLTGLLNGDWRQAWDGAKRVVDFFAPGVTDLVERMVDMVAAAFARLRPVFDTVITGVRAVERAFFDMADAVVFNSWVPDMVDGIIQHFGRLQGGMVDPALDATAATDEAFATMAGNVLNSLQGMASAIKSGGFFDLLRAGLNLGQQFGLFGSSERALTLGEWGFRVPTAADFPGTGATSEGFRNAFLGPWQSLGLPGFANGGGGVLGGFAGVDRNVLSLNGSPIARVSAGEHLRVTPANDRGAAGALRVTVTMDASTGALGAFVQDQAGRVVAQAAPQIVDAAANAGVARMMRRNERSFSG